MTLKMLLLFVCMALFSTTAYGKCKLRGERSRTPASKCNKPVLIPVTLSAEGFKGLNASVEFVNRCIEDLYCSTPNMKCIPTETRTKIVKASGYKSSNTGCVTLSVEVEEHVSCKCGCPGKNMCNKNQDYNGRMCECDCKQEVMTNCHKLREKYPGSGLMFEEGTCECKCPKEKECGTGEFFSHDTCNCMLDKENYLERNTIH